MYGDALRLTPDSVPLYINSAMAHLALGMPRDAHRDACRALALQPGSTKALHKRARAREALGDDEVRAQLQSAAGMGCIQQQMTSAFCGKSPQCNIHTHTRARARVVDGAANT